MISKSITEGFKFTLSVKRVIPYIILDLIVFYLLFSLFSNIINMIRFEGFNLLRFLLSLGLFIPAAIVIGLVQLWVNGGIIDQAKYFPRERPLTESFSYSASRYLTMFCAMIIYTVLVWIVSLPKYIGTILALAVALIFYFIYPAIIVDKKRCVDAFRKSYKTFMRYPLETFLTLLVSIVISLIIVGLFSLPLIFLFAGKIIDIWVKATASPTNISGPQPFFNSLIPTIMSAVRSPFFVPYLFILVVGLSLSKVFSLGVQTRLYINARKMEL
jgi:putative flippase GtrA